MLQAFAPSGLELAVEDFIGHLLADKAHGVVPVYHPKKYSDRYILDEQRTRVVVGSEHRPSKRKRNMIDAEDVRPRRASLMLK